MFILDGMRKAERGSYDNGNANSLGYDAGDFPLVGRGVKLAASRVLSSGERLFGYQGLNGSH